MRALAGLAVAALALSLPVAEAGKRGKLRTSVRSAHGKAPKRWRTVTRWEPARPAPAPAPTADATPAPALPAPDPRSVSVTSREYSFALSQGAVDAGTVRVQFDNSRAEDPHRLAILGPAGEGRAFDEVPAGAVVRYEVSLRSGRYRLLCPMNGHEALGMRATLHVR